MGLDGVILAAFLLGFPANEIVLPIMLMAYLQAGTLTQLEEISALSGILAAQGWTAITPLCLMIFCLFHWPCSTTCLTIHRETGSLNGRPPLSSCPPPPAFSSARPQTACTISWASCPISPA